MSTRLALRSRRSAVVCKAVRRIIDIGLRSPARNTAAGHKGHAWKYEAGAVGSTAVAFGRAPADAQALYVTTNGRLWSPYRGAVQEAKLVRIEVGEPAG